MNFKKDRRIKLFQLIASISGIGYIKGGGTVAAAITALLWFILMPANIWIQVFVTVVVLFTGIVVAQIVERSWGKDSNKIVIDEVLGMMVALICIPHQALLFFISFILFRFFDIVKPLGIRKLDKKSGGWRIMADDLVAGLYTQAVLLLLQYSLSLIN